MSRNLLNVLWLTPALLGMVTFAAIASVPQPEEAKEQTASSNLAADPVTSIMQAGLPAQTEASTSVAQLSNPQITSNSLDETITLTGQVTSVSQLTDVQPTDWAFQALQSLVERYGCIVGYPDRTYRGNRALSRYEFAAGMNACMDRINELIAAGTADLVRKEDLLALQKLQEEFAAELAVLRGQVDALEVRTATLERQQFSTTTKLNAEVIFALSKAFGDEGARGRFVSPLAGRTAAGAPTNITIFNPANSISGAVPPTLNIGSLTGGIRDRDRAAAVIREVYRVRGLPLTGVALNTALNTLAAQNVTAGGITSPRFNVPKPDLREETVFSNRVRINFDTSFTGRDRLRTRLEAGNFAQYNQGGAGNTGTNMTRLGYDTDTGNNQVFIDELWYRFPVGNLLTFQVDATNAEFQDSVIYTFNPLFQSSGTGALSRYGRFSPIYRLPGDNAAGAAFRYNFREFNNKFTFEGGYYAGGAGLVGGNPVSFPNDPSQKNGLFNGGFAALAQLIFRPTTNWDLGFTYVRSYFPEGVVNLSRSTGSDLSRRPFGNNVATSGNHFGFQTVYRFSPRLTFAGWVGYTIAEAQDNLNATISGVPGLAGTTPISIVDRGDNANILYWGGALGFTDVLKDGALLGFIFGQQPRVIKNDSLFGTERTSNWHIEALYRYPITDNIDLTPGFLVIINPENNSRNDTIWVGSVRATFRF